MKEIVHMPVRVQNGNKEIEVYEWEEGFAMTTEFLGKCIGYGNPKVRMAELFRRHRAELEPHQFAVTVTGNPTGNKLRPNVTYSGRQQHRFVSTAAGNSTENKLPPKVTYSDRGRPSFFYDRMGIIKAFMFANTPQAKEFGPKVMDYLDYLEKKRMERIEAYWFSVRPWWPEIRDRVMKGENFREIAEAMGRSSASVRNAVRRMIQVGILAAVRAAQALTGTARKTVIGYGRKYIKDDRQQALPFEGATV